MRGERHHRGQLGIPDYEVAVAVNTERLKVIAQVLDREKSKAVVIPAVVEKYQDLHNRLSNVVARDTRTLRDLRDAKANDTANTRPSRLRAAAEKRQRKAAQRSKSSTPSTTEATNV